MLIEEKIVPTHIQNKMNTKKTNENLENNSNQNLNYLNTYFSNIIKNIKAQN